MTNPTNLTYDERNSLDSELLEAWAQIAELSGELADLRAEHDELMIVSDSHFADMAEAERLLERCLFALDDRGARWVPSNLRLDVRDFLGLSTDEDDDKAPVHVD